jgi:hypothetical protein
MEYHELLLNIGKQFSQLSSIFTKVVKIQPILDNIRQHLTVFPSDFNNIDLKYFGILQNLMRNYEILQKFTKVDKSNDMPRYFLVKSLTSTLFRSITLYYWHFVILYFDEQNFSVCYHTVLPLCNIGKYFAMVKTKVIFPTSQILTF